MALVGLNARRDEIIQRMAELQRQLGVRSKGAAASMATQGPTAVNKVKRVMSAAARKRIADAQKLRWAKFRKSAEKPAAAAKKAAPKRKLSAAAKANLVANLAKARAAKAAKKTEGEAVPF
jgi:hypothetical protein